MLLLIFFKLEPKNAYNQVNNKFKLCKFLDINDLANLKIIL